MDADLISKKDLLHQAGISYGQLYRWKRKGLIPEEWFVRRSTFTGQETFFPRDKMLARVGKIQGMKEDDLSLDAIAEAVSPSVGDVALAPEDVVARGIASQAAVELFTGARNGSGPLVFAELVCVRVLDLMLKAGDISADEGRSLVAAMEESYAKTSGREFDVVFVRKLGFSAWALVPSGCEIHFESAARVVTLSLTDVIEGLKALLK